MHSRDCNEREYPNGFQEEEKMKMLKWKVRIVQNYKTIVEREVWGENKQCECDVKKGNSLKSM